MGPSLFGGFGSSIFELYPSRWQLMSIAGPRFSSGSAYRPSHHGIRRVRRSNLTRVLTAGLLPTLDPLRTRLTRRPTKDIFSPAVDPFSYPVSIKSRLHFRATTELAAIDPHSVHDDGNATSQGNDCLLQARPPCDGHGPGSQPRPLLHACQHGLSCLIEKAPHHAVAAQRDAADPLAFAGLFQHRG